MRSLGRRMRAYAVLVADRLGWLDFVKPQLIEVFLDEEFRLPDARASGKGNFIEFKGFYRTKFVIVSMVVMSVVTIPTSIYYNALPRNTPITTYGHNSPVISGEASIHIEISSIYGSVTLNTPTGQRDIENAQAADPGGAFSRLPGAYDLGRLSIGDYGFRNFVDSGVGNQEYRIHVVEAGRIQIDIERLGGSGHVDYSLRTLSGSRVIGGSSTVSARSGFVAPGEYRLIVGARSGYALGFAINMRLIPI